MATPFYQTVLLAYPNYMGGVADGLSVTPTISGGSWQVTAPASGLTSPYLAHRARSNGLSPASTQIVVDLGQTRPVYAVAIPKHNLSRDASYTVSVYADAALTSLASSGAGLTAPVIYAFGSLPFEHPSWWDGRATAENYALLPPPLLVVLGANVIGRYVVIAISDTANPAGYVEISRPIIAPGYQPTINVDYGAVIQINDPTIVTTSLGGAKMFDKRTKFRTFHGEIKHLPTNEAFTNIFDMQLRAGISLSGFFSYNPSDTINLARWSFSATFSQLDALTASTYGYTGMGISVVEVVA